MMCQHDTAAASQDRPRIPRAPLVIIAVVLPVIVAFAVTRGASGPGPNHSDRIFMRDLAAQDRDGRALAQDALLIRSGLLRNAASDLGRREVAQDEQLRGLGVTLAPGRQGPIHRDPSALRSALIAHSQDDVLLARIEVSSGVDENLRRLARDVESRETRRLRALRAIRLVSGP